MGNEASLAGRRETRSLSQAESNFWGFAPLVPGRRLDQAAHSGHLRAEVWSDGFVCMAMSDPRLMGAALAALADAKPQLTTERSLPDLPVMMQRPQSEFLGRVIVDFYIGGSPLVAAVGSDPGRLVKLAQNWLRGV